MSKLESFFIGVIIGPVLPLLFFVIGWWTSFFFGAERLIPIFSLLGLGTGCIVDLIIYKKLMKAYWWKQGVLAMIYLFYTIGFFGFFMGVPIFNLAVGAMAGVFMGRRFFHRSLTQEQSEKASTSFAYFTAVTMALVAMASAYFATKDIRDTALNLRGMLKLSFLPTKHMIIVLIVVGGIGLVLTQYWITKKLTRWAYRIGNYRGKALAIE